MLQRTLLGNGPSFENSRARRINPHSSNKPLRWSFFSMWKDTQSLLAQLCCDGWDGWMDENWLPSYSHLAPSFSLFPQCVCTYMVKNAIQIPMHSCIMNPGNLFPGPYIMDVIQCWIPLISLLLSP